MNEGLLVIDLSSKTARVTAAGQGIGRSSVTALAAAGAGVIATDINAAALDGCASDAVTTLALDVLDPAAIAAVVGGAGDIDILFNCAGVVHGGALLEATDADLDFAYELNVKAMTRMCRAVLTGMLARSEERRVGEECDGKCRFGW